MNNPTSFNPNISSAKISSAWIQFADRLAQVLKNLQEDQFVVLSVKQSGLYVQLVGQGSYGLRMETTSNYYLSKSEQLEENQIAMLIKLGWNHPTRMDDKMSDKNPDGSPNFFIDHSVPVPFDALSDLTIRTFAEVLRVPHPGYLEYNDFDSDGNSIPIPGLNLKRMKENDNIDPQEMKQYLLSTIRDFTGLTDLAYNQDKEIGIRFGSVVTFIRCMDKPPSIRFYAPLVSEVKDSPQLNARLNEFNSGIACMHFFHRNGIIIAMVEIPASPFIFDHVIQSLKMFAEISNGVDELLSAEFGGKKAFSEIIPSLQIH
ncbi:MAG: hypothetical protein R6U27_10970 [Desulfobacterales bacterium]